MKKFEYAKLEEKVYNGEMLWFLDDDIVNPTMMMGWKVVIYDSITLIKCLNLLGDDGWQAVSINGTLTGAILMREV